MQYPAWEIEYWKVYYSKEPSTADKNEFLLTQLINCNYHFNTKDCRTKPADFRFPNLWKSEQQVSDDALIEQFASMKGVKLHKKQ